MIEQNYLEYPASIQEAMGMKVDYTKLFPIYIAEQTGEGVISVTSDKQAYASGSTFYLTILLEEGYELEELSVVDNNDDEIELTKKSETELPDGSTEIIMFGIMGISPIFAQAARAKKKNVLKFAATNANPTVKLSCIGEIQIISKSNGETIKNTYQDLSYTKTSIQSDAMEDIIIYGDLTVITTKPSEQESTPLTSLDCTKCASLQRLELSGSTLTEVNIENNTNLTYISTGSDMLSIDTSKNPLLTGMTVGNKISILDLSNNPLISSLSFTANNSLTLIKVIPSSISVASQVADGITKATSGSGTVYTDSASSYYSTIETAATTKGWTIEQIPA